MIESISQRFINGLKDRHKLTLEDFQKDYSYAGGDFDRHINYTKLLFSEGFKRPPYYPLCVCGQAIKRNCYMSNEGHEKIIILGSCCIEKFAGDGKKGRTCSICKEPHKNRTTNLCNGCKVKENKLKNRKCISCGSKLSDYTIKNYPNCKHCYDCYKKKKSNYTNVCSKCGDKIASSYKMCYKCKFH